MKKVSGFRCQVSGLLVVVALSFSALGQEVATVTSSNVTSWAAQLHGAYSSLSTAETYSVGFGYGLTDGTNDIGSWTYQSGEVTVSPSGTNTAGTFSRTVVELPSSTTVYYRAFATYGTNYLWSTQTLSLVTLSQAPTTTPTVLYFAVTVDTNGVLHGPTNFFTANGIIPTQGVASLNVRISSNEVLISTLNTGKYSMASGLALETGKVNKATANTQYVARTSGAMDKGQYVEVDSIKSTNDLDVAGHQAPTNLATAGADSGDVIIRGHKGQPGINSGGAAGRIIHFLGNSSSGSTPGNPSEFVVYDDATNMLFRISRTGIIDAIEIAGKTNVTVRGRDGSLASDNGGAAIIRGGSAGSGAGQNTGPKGGGFVARASAGANGILYGGDAGNLDFYFANRGLGGLSNGSYSAFRVFDENSNILFSVTKDGVISTNFVGFYRGIGTGITGLTITNLNRANSYTGGVMTLRTTDGVSFFLE